MLIARRINRLWPRTRSICQTSNNRLSYKGRKEIDQTLLLVKIKSSDNLFDPFFDGNRSFLVLLFRTPRTKKRILTLGNIRLKLSVS